MKYVLPHVTPLLRPEYHFEGGDGLEIPEVTSHPQQAQGGWGKSQEEASSCTGCLDLSLVCYKTLKEQADTWAMALFLLILKGNLHTFLL